MFYMRIRYVVAILTARYQNSKRNLSQLFYLIPTQIPSFHLGSFNAMKTMVFHKSNMSSRSN